MRSNDGLYTTRKYKVAFAIFLSAAFGSVFGFFGSFVGGMRVVEKAYLVSLAKGSEGMLLNRRKLLKGVVCPDVKKVDKRNGKSEFEYTQDIFDATSPRIAPNQFV